MKISIVKISLLVLVSSAFAQNPSSSTHVEVFPLSGDSSHITISLSKNFIIESSIQVYIDSTKINSFSYSRNLNNIQIEKEYNTSSKNIISVTYSYLPFTLQKKYHFRSLVFKNDSLNTKQKRTLVTQSEGVFTNMFGPELSKSGSITRGFLVGSNRDLTLSSGFRLQMAGKLSDDIDILAALTDENTPLQPQGNTQTLQEIDNVFVEIKSPSYTATLGDFQLNIAGGEFVTINRKLQGARLLANYQNLNPKTEAQIIGATSKGKFNTNQFAGIEGVQGPYRLTGKNNERAIIIIAGTEKIYVDGELMLRGEQNDYSIEYGSAEIIFSTRRLITSASRIVVDFEYADRQFTRNFVGVDATTKLFSNLSVRTNYFREGDDPDAPIDISLTEADKEILRLSGNASASKTGVIFAGTGKGNYTEVDTMINLVPLKIYRFEQDTLRSDFHVAFSNVGQGNGDYVREGIGKYRFLGIKLGTYAPIIILPKAQLQEFYSFQTNYKSSNDFSVNAEYAVSSFDQNRFSSLNDELNGGYAFKLSAIYSPKDIMIANVNIGDIDLQIFERYKDDRFLTLDRSDAVEFGRKWSTDSLASGALSNEQIREGKLLYQPQKEISIATSVGSLEKENQFSSIRYDGSIDIKRDHYPTISYFIENITGDEKKNQITNNWLRQKGRTEYTVYQFTPSFRFENEHREVINDINDSLLSSSFSFNLFAPKLEIKDILGLDLSSEFERRDDKAIFNGELIPQSNSTTQFYAVAIREVQNFSASSNVTLREKYFEKEFQANNTNQSTTLINIQSRYRPYSQGLDIDLFYDAATQRTAKLERYFYKVRKGEGQYIWIDANSNGIVDLNDEREFVPDRYDGEYIILTLNSESLIPIINLKASSRVRITPTRFINNPTSFSERLLTAVSSETYFRLEERSTEQNTRRIYLLDFNSLLNPATTQLGFQFLQQDIFLFEYNPDYSFRFRFNQRTGISQFSSGLENNYSRERSIRSRFRVSNEIANQTDIISKNDNAVSSSPINPSRQIINLSFVTDLSYRPENNIEFGVKLETSQSEDQVTINPIIADFNGQTIRLVYGFLSNGQVRTEFSREEIVLSQIPAGYSVPYELTSGRDFGKNYLWTISSEYRMGGNVQFSFQYSGRTTSRTTIVHNGRMEVRAYF